MSVFRYSRSRYFPDGSRTIEIETDGISPKEGVKRALEAISDAEAEERRLSIEKMQERERELRNDPEIRLEVLKAEKLKLEISLREISAEIMKEEERMSDGK